MVVSASPLSQLCVSHDLSIAALHITGHMSNSDMSNPNAALHITGHMSNSDMSNPIAAGCWLHDAVGSLPVLHIIFIHTPANHRDDVVGFLPCAFLSKHTTPVIIQGV
jgi:hypothetical protein